MTTIHWTFRDFAGSEPNLEQSTWQARLGAKEREELAALGVPKRRAEWLAARLAAKDLFRKSSRPVEDIPDASITVEKESQGTPFLALEGKGRVEGCLSISHSEGKVFCALAHDEGIRFGIDVEKITPRAGEFVGDFFTASEACSLAGLTGMALDTRVTLIWSAKEAALKTLGLGLREDTRKVEVTDGKVVCVDGWKRIALIDHTAGVLCRDIIWRQEAGFVLTVCLPDANKVEFRRWD